MISLTEKTEMEFYFESAMTNALKSSFLSDSSTFLLDDFLSLNPAAVSAAADVDFSSVDSFLDLSDDDKDKGAFLRPEEEEEISNSPEKSETLAFTTAAAETAAVEFPLPQQDEDFEDLAWLSRFVEHDEDNDSDSKLTSLYNVNHHRRRSQPSDTSPPPILLCFSSPIPSRSRSKRTRPAGKPWGSAAVTLSISASSFSSSSSSSTISYGSSNPSITSTRPPKLKRSRLESEKQSRRCSHCHVEKTPQWRSGPLGAKTLCNACGVRYKSGRLFPEYRPACSPSFTGELHSNSHRKVLEMRRKKEMKLE